MDKKLSELCNQPPLLNFDGFYIIRPFDGWHIWLENSHGEGCTIRKQEFLNVLHTLFQKHF